MMSRDQGLNQLAKQIFGKSEVQNRIALNTVKMIVGDVVTLYAEFRKAEGLGALFFNPKAPDKSQYMTIKDIQNDISLAEEILNGDLKDFLLKLINIINREEENSKPVVVMIDNSTMSIHVIDPEKAQERINEFSNAFSGD